VGDLAGGRHGRRRHHRYAADQLGDVGVRRTPEVGKSVGKGDSLAVVESVKAASDVYAPVAGEVVEANADLSGAPETVNADPEGSGWFAKVRVSNPGDVEQLMSKDEYDAYVAGL
jgi:glycine cleavage system H protein